MSLVRHKQRYTFLFLPALLACLLMAVARQPLHAEPQYQIEANTHTIQPGESLSRIAERYGISMAALMAANEIEDPDAILIGQVLVVPAPTGQMADRPNGQSTGQPAVQVDTTYVPDDPPTSHVVQPGETLSEIAARYGMDMDQLMQINGIDDPDTIFWGLKLRLTPAIATAAAQAPEAVAATSAYTEPYTSTNPIATRNRIYTATGDETITELSIRLAVNEDALRKINRLPITGSVTLEAGIRLILPAMRSDLVGTNASPAATEAGDETEENEYVVRNGDNLGLIAQRVGLSLADLMQENQIEDPDAIYIGQRLRIPRPVVATSEANEPDDSESVAAEMGRPRSGFYHYTVKAGDSLSELAREFDSTVLAIMEYNDLPNAQTLYRDLQLRIPYGPPDLPVNLPPAPLSGTQFLVSLSRQQCWVFQGDRVLHAWTCSTGYGQWITRTGAFSVQTKLELAQSTVYELDMPYWLGIYDVGSYENGIHGLPIEWETGQRIWEGMIGQPATFGCAMLRDEDAATLFDLAYLGMPVYIVQ